MDHSSGEALACPYCGQALEWVPRRWFGRGAFRCGRCGEFPDLTPAAGPARAAALPQPPPPIAGSDRPRVLLVDDSAEFRDLYALMLEQTATVVTASRGEDALMLACAERLDAIVLDVMMPGMDGWRTCERLKANPLTSGIPVIMLTSWDGPDVPRRAERAGAAAVLIKPCRLEQLIAAIAAALGRRFGGHRRWTRKAVRGNLPMFVDDRPSLVLNVSYGGLCLEVASAPPSLPAPIRLAAGREQYPLRAEAVWVTHGLDAWVCGAEIDRATDEWRRIVDGV
ncbi:MAG: response regulator [Acidobacteria bacterium]|nr:response regulator [Acidobacteriota bacterium]